MSFEDMAVAHARDSRRERLLRDAARALRELDDAGLGPDDEAQVNALRARLQAKADQIVAVWD